MATCLGIFDTQNRPVYDSGLNNTMGHLLTESVLPLPRHGTGDDGWKRRLNKRTNIEETEHFPCPNLVHYILAPWRAVRLQDILRQTIEIIIKAYHPILSPAFLHASLL